LETLNIARKNGVTPSNCHALLALMSDPPMRPTDVAKACGITNAAVTQCVDILERQGLLERTTTHNDRRTIWLVPSERAFELFGSIIPELEEVPAR
jgi:DNA-binding MarR family transcriptional regulator